MQHPATNPTSLISILTSRSKKEEPWPWGDGEEHAGFAGSGRPMVASRLQRFLYPSFSKLGWRHRVYICSIPGDGEAGGRTTAPGSSWWGPQSRWKAMVSPACPREGGYSVPNCCALLVRLVSPTGPGDPEGLL